MLRLERLVARQCCSLNVQLPGLGARAMMRRAETRALGRMPLAGVPEDALAQAQSAMEALGNMSSAAGGAAPAAAAAAAPAFTEQNVEDIMRRTKSRRKHKRDLPLDEAQAASIRERIAASMARKAAKARFLCPACGVTLTRVDGVLSHMARCCADLLPQEAAGQPASAPDAASLQQVLSQAAPLEAAKRRRAMEITFLPPQEDAGGAAAAGAPAAADHPASSSSDDEGGEGEEDGGDYERGYSRRARQRIQDAPAEIAQELGVPLARAQRLLAQAMRMIPIAVDTSGALDVVAEDGDFIAVNKPVGYHTAPIHRWQSGSVVNLLLGHLARQQQHQQGEQQQQVEQQQQQQGQQQVEQQQVEQQQVEQRQQGQQAQRPRHAAHAKPYVLHRLDINTSGLLLFAKRRDVVPGVAAQFRERRVRKRYLAVTAGVPPRASFTVDAPIGDHPSHDTARRIRPDGKQAQTEFLVLSANPDADLQALCAPGALFHERGGGPLGGAARGAKAPRGAALVCCWPRTGRTHQIRLHLAHVGHPLVGDEVYGVTGPWIGRQALHAWTLELEHPLSGEPLRYAAPLHEDFEQALGALGLALPDAPPPPGL